MLYIGTKKQKEILHKRLEENETYLAFEENEEKIKKLHQECNTINQIIQKGCGIIKF